MSDRCTAPVPTIAAGILADIVNTLQELLPLAFTECKGDFAGLHDLLGNAVDERPERYSFTWAGNRSAIRLRRTKARAVLNPTRAESMDSDATHDPFIEGDNPEVLKLLYKYYFGKVKQIYRDLPDDTCSDFVYADNDADSLDIRLLLAGRKDGSGNLFIRNASTDDTFAASPALQCRLKTV